MLSLALTPLLLAGCVGSAMPGPVVELKSQISQPPAALATPCGSPAALPMSPLSAGSVERLWAQDRSVLALCGRKLDGLVEFYQTRDKGLAGG